LLIENKKKARFLSGQAEGYGPKGRFMSNKSKYLNFSDFSTVLLAPMQFRAANRKQADIFDTYIAYEKIAEFVPEFGSA
jgi:hypothetical protein